MLTKHSQINKNNMTYKQTNKLCHRNEIRISSASLLSMTVNCKFDAHDAMSYHDIMKKKILWIRYTLSICSICSIHIYGKTMEPPELCFKFCDLIHFAYSSHNYHIYITIKLFVNLLIIIFSNCSKLVL